MPYYDLPLRRLRGDSISENDKAHGVRCQPEKSAYVLDRSPREALLALSTPRRAE
jgi:hypothetical protein